MFIRKNKNRKGGFSIQLVQKVQGKYKLIKTIGTGNSSQEIEFLVQKARQELHRLSGSQTLFTSKDDALIESFLKNLRNAQIQVIGPELVFGKIYGHIGFGAIANDLFRHLVITRLYHPGSKLKTIDYLLRFQGVQKNSDEIYRFLDKLSSELKEGVEQIAFAHTSKVLNGNISMVFYDMTTLHFEAADEDDLRKTGFSKAGKHQHPQIYLGLLVGLEGFPIGYDIYEGNIFEGHTLIPFLKKMEAKFKLNKPVVVADAGLLTNQNIEQLQQQGYRYILGARIKNEATALKHKIISQRWSDGHYISIKKNPHTRLIVAYSDKRAANDEHNRMRGLRRLEKILNAGKLTKANINNKGYNKYLRLMGEIKIEIDYDKFNQDKQWDGLKGYITNADLSPKQIIANYNQLWQIEKAFRISKTDLQIRPIYHRLRNRIEAHICIAFTAYSIYKELERVLKKEKSSLSLKRAADLTHSMYQINAVLPESKHHTSILLQMDEEQSHLHEIILKNY